MKFQGVSLGIVSAIIAIFLISSRGNCTEHSILDSKRSYPDLE